MWSALCGWARGALLHGSVTERGCMEGKAAQQLRVGLPPARFPARPLAPQGTLYVTLGKSETLSKFEVWRLCYFIAG